MRILMIAPEPFFEPRGTPFSEFHRIRALTALGHQVDLVTYPFGEDVAIPRLRVFRCLRPPFLHHVKIGPSAGKVALDALLTLTVLRRALSARYDAVHSHEEGGLIGAPLAMILRVPHLYDMHSSLPQQLTNFAFSRSRVIRRVFLAIERFMIRRSRVVIVICPSLEETVRAVEPHARIVLIENAPGSADDQATPAEASAVRRGLGLEPSTPMVLYTGTFEAYQGLDLLFEAMAVVHRSRPDARLVLAGGKPDQVARAKAQARELDIDAVTLFAGERPASEIPRYLLASDVLVSPRSRGTNTPLKIYQYLRSGRPIVATRLLTHTQVLDDHTAVLTGASPHEFAAGILAALNDPARSAALGRQARDLADTKYSYEAYLEKTRQACAALFSPVPSASNISSGPGAMPEREPSTGSGSTRAASRVESSRSSATATERVAEEPHATPERESLPSSATATKRVAGEPHATPERESLRSSATATERVAGAPHATPERESLRSSARTTERVGVGPHAPLREDLA